MKQPGELDVTGQILAQREIDSKKASRGTKITRGIWYGWLISLFIVAVIAGWKSYHPQPKVATNGTEVVFISPGDGISIAQQIDLQPTKYALVTDPDLMTAFHGAVSAWRVALGGKLPINYPTLVKAENRGECSYSVLLAYAEMEKNRIVYCRSGAQYDSYTLMLHEIGHLLGVPHIEQDSLMNSYTVGKKVKGPTPFAVAIAKAVHPQ